MKVFIIMELLFGLFCSPTTGHTNKTTTHKPHLKNNSSICTTQACNATAGHILYNLDESVKPCHDFFKFACGGFQKQARVPNYASSLSYFGITQGRILYQLKKILQTPLSSEPKPFSQLKKFYKLCMDMKRIERDGLKKVDTLLFRLGGWPVVEGLSWKENLFDWKEFIYKARKMGLPYDSIINVKVDTIGSKTAEPILGIDQPSLGLEREYLIKERNNTVVKAYQEYLVDLAVILGARKYNVLEEIRNAIDFEIKLAKISRPRNHISNIASLPKYLKVSELIQKYPNIPWKEFLSNIADDSTHTIYLSNITKVIAPKYMQFLENLLKETPKRTQANYLSYRVLLSLVPYLNEKIRNRTLQFYEIKYGVTKAIPRYGECTIMASSKLHFAAGALYVRRHFSETAKQATEKLAANIKATFINMLKQVKWLDQKTKHFVLEKAIAMQIHVGYPSELKNDTKLEQFYSKLNTDTNNFLEFSLAINKFSIDANFQRLFRPFNKSDWTGQKFITFVNAYYDSMENSIQLPAAILQSPFFDTNRPVYMNYGAIGNAIAHEMIHPFNDFYLQFNKNGIALDTKNAFMKRAKCIVDQYRHYFAPEINSILNSTTTTGEDIADIGGVKLAYLAYADWVKINGEEQSLPNLKYTAKQMFWISTANMWCTSLKPEALKHQILTDVHSPARYRVFGSLSNTEQFAIDFNCLVGARMNPVNKCQIL